MKFLFTKDAKWLRVAVFALFFATLPLVLEYGVLFISEREDYFTYSALEVLRESVDTENSSIKVYSYAVIQKTVPLYYKDVLFCNGEFTESNESSTIADKGRLPRMQIDENGNSIPIPWRFDIKVNLVTGESCYVTSTVTAKLRFGFEFSQQITSNTFIIQ